MDVTTIEKLNEKNISLYDDMVTYINLCKLTKNDKLKCIDTIFGEFLYIQNNNKTIDEVIGTDYKKYCDSIIDKIVKDTSKVEYLLYKIKEYVVSISLLVGIYYFVQNFMLFKNKQQISLDLQVSSNILLLISLIVIMMYIAIYCINKETKKRCFDVNKNFIKNQGAIVLTLSFFILYIILNVLTKIIPNIIIKIPIYIIIGSLFTIYLTLNILINKK